MKRSLLVASMLALTTGSLSAAICHCDTTRHRRRIFSLSLGDWLDDEVPIEWLAEMLDTIRRCDQVTWILCSKRWHLAVGLLEKAMATFGDDEPTGDFISDWIHGGAPRHVVGLCSVENQEMADKRIQQFLTVPLACHGLSMEPLLTGVVIDSKHLQPDAIRWLIIGGESGPNARPCNVDWIRSLVQQGQAAGVATFVKQLGTVPVLANDSDDQCWPGATIPIDEKYNPTHQGELAPLRLTNKKGGDPAEWPEDLRVQQFPILNQ